MRNCSIQFLAIDPTECLFGDFLCSFVWTEEILFRERECEDFTYKGYISCVQISYAEGNKLFLPSMQSVIPPSWSVYIRVIYKKKKKKRWATHDWKDECLVCQRKIVLIKDMSSKLPCFCIRNPMSKPMCHILPLKQGEGWLDLQVFFVDPLHDTGKNSEREVLDPEPKETESTINMETFPYERW